MKSRVQNQQLEFSFDAKPPPESGNYEPLLTIREACVPFHLQPHILRRAIKSGALRSYRFANGRIRVRASEIQAAIEKSGKGGQS